VTRRAVSGKVKHEERKGIIECEAVNERQDKDLGVKSENKKAKIW